MIDDIEDNYPEFLNDTMGYAWNAWDILSQREIALHDRIQSGDEDNLTLGDLGVWAQCNKHLKESAWVSLIELGETLFPVKKESSQALAYDEIAAVITNAMIREERFEEAETFLKARVEEYPDAVEIRISRFLLKAALLDESLDEEIQNTDDREFLFDLSEAFLEAGYLDAAHLSHTRCRALVADEKLSAIYVDLESMDRRLEALSLSGEKLIREENGEALKNHSAESVDKDT